MNEKEWLACSNPLPMVCFLKGKVSDRKLRLFACACWSRFMAYLEESKTGRALEVARQFADGQSTLEDLTEARKQTEKAVRADPRLVVDASCRAAVSVTQLSAFEAARETVRFTEQIARAGISYADIPGFNARQAEADALREERWDQCELLRHIVGNPFRPIVVDPAWLRWNSGAVVKIARAIYDENRFDDLPFLADALTDAGCDNEEILTHCRTPMEHPRGCWVVDALLPPSTQRDPSTQRQQVLE